MQCRSNSLGKHAIALVVWPIYKYWEYQSFQLHTCCVWWVVVCRITRELPHCSNSNISIKFLSVVGTY